MNGDAAAFGLQVAVAVALLMLGRRLYWVFVAGVGVAVVLSYAVDFLAVEEGWVPLAIAAAAGVAGALLVVFLQRLAITVAGFLGAAYVVRELAESLGIDAEVRFVAILVAGVLGALVAGTLFDWALIFMSSIAGAVLLVDAFDVPGQAGFVVLVIVAIAGVAIQSNILHRDRRHER